MAQSVEYLTLDFSSGHDPRFVGSNHELGSVLTVQSRLGILSLSLSLSLSFCLPLPLSPAHPLSLSQIKDNVEITSKLRQNNCETKFYIQ